MNLEALRTGSDWSPASADLVKEFVGQPVYELAVLAPSFASYLSEIAQALDGLGNSGCDFRDPENSELTDADLSDLRSSFLDLPMELRSGLEAALANGVHFDEALRICRAVPNLQNPERVAAWLVLLFVVT